MTTTARDRVCARCARRTWLLGRLAGHLEVGRGHLDELLALEDEDLIAAVAGRERDAVRRELAAVDPAALAADRARGGVEAVCRCDGAYPSPLRDLTSPPAVLHVAGGLDRLAPLLAAAAVAIVGSRRASEYGRDVARSLAADCGRAGLAVVSGLALGIDARAHEGALAAGGATIAVMPGGAGDAYPASHRTLHARVRRHGVAVSELAPGVRARRWMFPARNRLIAALGAMTIVVQAGEDSGALLTAAWARSLGRPLGAVPGQVTVAQSVGPHRLLRTGARVIEGVGDVLDALYGADAAARAAALARRARPRLAPPLDQVYAAIAAGEGAEAACASAGVAVDEGLAALAALELAGHVRRVAGGRYVVM